MGSDIVAVARALDFAARKHSNQRRKGEAGEPYVNHLAEVAKLVADATEGRDPVAVVAALLHDTIEDTGTSRAELEREFGREVADIVVEVTDDKTLPKTERKRLQEENAPHKSSRAKLVKIADKTSNLRSIAQSPPLEWDLKRQRDYFDWAARVVAGCRGTNATLERWFDEAHAAGLEALSGR
jgi:GTP diphosphokinase / guanosine-3',5'-bis(diphosphate) 3'-diphosphatase